MPSEEEREKYYHPCQGYVRMQNKAARRSYFDDTEPSEELPTHGRVLSTKKAAAITNLFFARLELDILRNTQFAWRLGTPLPPINNPVQPMADDADNLNQPP